MAEEEDNESQELCQKLKMSSIHMKSTEEECYPRDSLDRYGDDLCEEILSYLSLEDCFRFECLSKQWQRLIFKPQVYLNLDEVVNKLIIKKDIKYKYLWFTNINCQALESIIKKLPNIRSIDITISSEETKRVFERLMNLYKHSIIAINIWFRESIDFKILDIFLGKYSSLLTTISIPRSLYDKFIPYAKYMPKLRQLYGYTADTGSSLLSTIVIQNHEILLKNLTHFQCPYETSDGNLLPAFVDHYKNSLKSLSIVFKWNGVTVEEYINVLSQISQMKALRELSVGLIPPTIWKHHINSHKIEAIVDYHCEEFVNQWPHLKRYRLNILCESGPEVRRVYESMNRMKRLRRLELIFEIPVDLIGHKVLVTPKSLSPLKGLTHLSICLKKSVLNETFFDSIHTHLPHIQSLKINQLKITPTIEKEVEPFQWKYKKCYVHMATSVNIIRPGSFLNLSNCPNLRKVIRHPWWPSWWP